MSAKQNIVVRIAPSPTGNLHIGNARTALFNYLYAKKHGGKFILRIEDTDKERSKKEFEENILDGLRWLGITWDELYRQSERTDIYKKYLKKMVDDGHAYVSKEEVKKEGDRAEVIRLKNPNKKIRFDDIIRGEIEFDTTELKDFVIAKSFDEPLYHLAVVIDDHEMGVTHILRGEDHISNTPRQILIGEAIGVKRPLYGHIPLILAPDRSRLSKRHGAVALTQYRDEGYLPEAMVNYLALLSWNPGGTEEIFTMDQLVELFDLSKVQKGGAVFNIEKLNWMNREYLKRDGAREVREAVQKLLEPATQTLVTLVLEHINTLSDIPKLLSKEGEFAFLFARPHCAAEKIPGKNSDAAAAARHLEKAANIIGAAGKTDKESAKAALMPYADTEGRGAVLWPLRFALTGMDRSPDPFTVIELLGKEESLARIDAAIKELNA